MSPIENLWFWMKDWLDRKYDIQSLNLEGMRAAIEEAWEAIPLDYLGRLDV